MKKFICLLSAAVIMLMSFSACGGKDEEETTTSAPETTTEEVTVSPNAYVVKTNDGDPLNMRSGAGSDYSVVTTVPNGTRLIISEQKDGWGFTLFGNYSGWVSMNYIVKLTDVQETLTDSQSGTQSVTQQGSSQAGADTTVPVTQSGYAYSYAGFNPTEITIDDAEWNLTLVNRNYILKEGYVPKLAEAVEGSGVYLDYRVAPYYQKMYDAAKKDGVTLTPNSGYRSYETQKNNFNNKINLYVSQGYDKVTATQNAARIILPPGTSEHNAGFAMDIGWVTEDFEYSSAYAWLDAHAHDYGFILRYPKAEDKQAITEIIYEPWHWRYVGVEAAKAMKESGQVLEEYLGRK